MSRSKWSLVFGSLAALSLLLCQNLARAEELESAPQPPDGSSAPAQAPAQKPALAKDSGCCVEQACSGEMCVNRNFIIDVSAVWLAPIQHQNFGTVGLGTFDDEIFTPTLEHGTTNDSDFTLSPRITVGVQGDCWGVLVRYWKLENCDLNSTLSPDAFEGVTAGSEFRAQTLDVEATRLIYRDCEDNMFRASFGFRYAELKEAANLNYTNFPNAATVYQSSVFAQHQFSGPGVTFGLQGFHRVNCSNFNLFFDARGSFIFDNDATDSVTTEAAYANSVGGLVAHHIDQGLTSSATNLFIGEIQLGGQWNIPLKCVPANAFVRLAFEYQYWAFNNGGEAASISGAGPLGGTYAFASGESSGNTHIDMVGFNIGTGLTW